jgi:hypothetical protein
MHHALKSMTRFLTAAAAVIAISAPVPVAKAADIALDGPAYFSVAKKARYYSGGAWQGGRYLNLGRGYYRRADLGIGAVDNYSPYESGDLSFEFWAMPFYGATKGVILMTTDIGWLEGDQSFVDLEMTGSARFLNRKRFPEMNLWEYTYYGWEFRDAFAFARRSRL